MGEFFEELGVVLRLLQRYNGAAEATMPAISGDTVLMLKIRARTNESVEQMLKRFKKLCEKEGITKEMKRLSYYEKPSERRRRRLRKAQRREMREQMLRQ